ncbi:MAG: amidase [Candidatus Aminicenantes bacterium]|nr:amidase [Candidatus Aminicenantes bacterium]NIM83750.1 amidase [Candidatus Aminicenantes bacterium]NIN23210.1 amidase [Candidatus Aminicenantes bacterium]NIN46904.1 amidase [Candidatus Aminicenantes bacterium]NIN89826.1 amidase [Candidatus Aminicenantes bacterium]
MENQPQSKKVSIVWIIIAAVFILLFIVSLVIDIPYIIGIRGAKISPKDVATAGKVIGLEFTSKEIQLMLKGIEGNLESYQELRNHQLDNSVFPAINFSPLIPYAAEAAANKIERQDIVLPEIPDLKVPDNLEDLAFAPVTVLSQLIRTGKITSTELTKMYLKRLKRYNPTLECVVTLTEDLALEQARRADEEIAAGKYRGPLHGIPWGVKDLFATKGIKTTWGAVPYKDQVIDIDATVVKRLEEAGAVLVAKLTSGALAWGDVWFGGKTKNPWNTKQGSSGSSAGPASATAAGLVGFSIGTETWGSIISPSHTCGVTGLRPTYGRVSRYGAMALSWSMDKAGPICRSAEDCALVFNAIYGADGKDFTVVNRPFHYDPSVNIKTLRIGYVKALFEKGPNKINDARVLETLRSLGINLIPIELPDFPVGSLGFILNAEAAAAFDELTRSGKDDLMARQIRRAWPNVFRQSRLIPAVEYIQANRFRTLLIKKMAANLKDIDVYIVPTNGGNHLLLTNLTGHPAVVVPNGFDKEGSPISITFMGNLFKEAEALLVAKAFQEATGFHKKHPKLD